MKPLSVLVSLFSAAQAQLSITIPRQDETIRAGQNVTMQLTVPASMSPYAGQLEISLVIGMINCTTSGCPAPSADLGEIQFVGKFVNQDMVYASKGYNFVDNMNVTVPKDLSSNASIQVQHSYAIQTPVNLLHQLSVEGFHAAPQAHAQPFVVEYTSVGEIQVSWG